MKKNTSTPLIITLFCLSVQLKAELICDTPVFDFGEKEEGSIITHTFVLKNTGNSAVVIDRIRTTCGCTVATPSARVVGAGKNVELNASINLSKRTGKQDKKIYICTRDSKQRLELILKGISAPTIEITPSFLYFGRVIPGTEATNTISIRGLKEPLAPGIVQCSSKYISCELTSGKHDNEYILTGTLNSNAPPGDIRGNVSFPIYGGSDQLSFPVYASIPASLFISPTSITIHTNENQPFRRILTVRPGKVRDFSILSIECPDTTAKINISEIDSGGFSITLEQLNPAIIDGKSIIIKTNAKGAEEIHIPCQTPNLSNDL